MAANRQEMLVALDRKRLASALIQMAFTGAVVCVVPLRMGQSKPLPKAAHGAVHVKTDNQMPVIGHQALRE